MLKPTINLIVLLPRGILVSKWHLQDEISSSVATSPTHLTNYTTYLTVSFQVCQLEVRNISIGTGILVPQCLHGMTSLPKSIRLPSLSYRCLLLSVYCHMAPKLSRSSHLLPFSEKQPGLADSSVSFARSQAVSKWWQFVLPPPSLQWSSGKKLIHHASQQEWSSYPFPRWASL